MRAGIRSGQSSAITPETNTVVSPTCFAPTSSLEPPSPTNRQKGIGFPPGQAPVRFLGEDIVPGPPVDAEHVASERQVRPFGLQAGERVKKIEDHALDHAISCL